MKQLTNDINKLIHSDDFNQLALLMERESGRELANAEVFQIMITMTTIHYAKILDKFKKKKK